MQNGPAELRLSIKEIYFSIQGEASHTGWPCVFIRTAGCNIRCDWCDTTDAFQGGQRMSVEEILSAIQEFPCELVQVTGGEPLLQKNCPALLEALVRAGYQVLLETGGHMDTAGVPPGVRIILDVKCPGAGEGFQVDWRNLEYRRPGTEYKFVLSDRRDFEFMLKKIEEYNLEDKGTVWASPVSPGLDPRRLVEWILQSGRSIRLNTQIHKWIWGPNASGV